MTGRVAIVTDSAACLPDELLKHYRITVVPHRVTVGKHAGFEASSSAQAQQLTQRADVKGSELITADMVAHALQARVPVRTSRPSIAQFHAAYQQELSTVDHVVSVHVSSALSGTIDAARAAARQFNGKVSILDSQSAAMGLGFVVLAAARCVAAGGSWQETLEAADAAIVATTSLFIVDSLEYLHRGGRIGAAAALVGSALAVKPILYLRDGAIVVREKVRTRTRAMARLEQLLLQEVTNLDDEFLGNSRIVYDIAIHHVNAGERAEMLRKRLVDQIKPSGLIIVGSPGAAVSAHVGPGLLCAVLHRRSVA